MRDWLIGGCCLILMTAGSGCGAIFGGTKQSVRIDVSPPGTDVTVSPINAQYATPTVINLERGTKYVLVFEKEGYRKRTFEVERKLRGGIVALDIIFTGLIGVIVDAATGSWYKQEPEVITLALEKMGKADGPDQINLTLHWDHKQGVISIAAPSPGVRMRLSKRE